MRVIFFGTSTFAVPSLEAVLTGGHSVAMCVTQPDRPRGRGLRPGPSPVKEAAERLQVPLSQPARPVAGPLRPLEAQVGVVVAYGNLIPREILMLPAYDCLGVHPSLLPKYRGAAPIAWAILNGETETGVSIFRLNERLDAGDVLLQRRVSVAPNEETDVLAARLASLGADALVVALTAIQEGTATFTAQDDTAASLAPKLTKAQGRIDWTQSAEQIERQVRATIPWPGATTSWHGASLKVWGARIGAAAREGAAPGTVLVATAECLEVACGTGSLSMLDVQPADKRRMSIAAFLAGHKVQGGDTFESEEQETGGGRTTSTS